MSHDRRVLRDPTDGACSSDRPGVASRFLRWSRRSIFGCLTGPIFFYISLEQFIGTQAWADIARGYEEVLGLSAAPIAITFSAERPEGIDAFDAPIPPPMPDGRTGSVSAGCVFWMEGVDRTFSTVAADHGNCSVGSLTHGFVTVDDIVGNEDVGALLGRGWVEEEAVAQIPVVAETPGAVTYGPLRETPIGPDVVFLRLDGTAVMLLTGTFPELGVSGKPQCGIVATAKDHGEIALSAGCALSRARTGMPDDEVTCAIPAARAAEVLERLRSTKATNDTVVGYALKDARRFSR